MDAPIVFEISSVRFNLEQIQVERYTVRLVSLINLRKPFQNGFLSEIRFTKNV